MREKDAIVLSEAAARQASIDQSLTVAAAHEEKLGHLAANLAAAEQRAGESCGILQDG